ncbi:MAG: serine hydrolase [Halochromatium sp.]|uniref:serine hydrolase n=1 Tax=Halochromatium sp. TaxID=2049430 RepID=UPI00397A87D8
MWGAHRADAGSAGLHLDRRRFIATLGGAAASVLLGAPRPSVAATSPLESQLVRLVKQQRVQGLIRADEQTSWSIYDFTSARKLVSINEAVPRQAASMIKPFIAQAFFYTMQEQGSRLRYTPSVRETMERMIRNSSNPATTELMQLISHYNGNHGPKDVEYVLKRHAPGVFQQTSIVEYVPANGRTYRNLASAHDYSRYLWALWHDRMPYAHEVRRIMGLPNHNRITRGVNNIPSTVRVYHKSGSTAMLCGEMGIIEAHDRLGRPRPYTFIGIIQKSQRTNYYTTWITNRSNTLRAVSGLVYDYMRDQHQLA